MSSYVRAKFRVSEMIQHDHYAGPEPGDVTVKLRAVTGKEGDNAIWSSATPIGEIIMRITNPGAHSKFKAGQEFYLDFIPADVQPPS